MSSNTSFDVIVIGVGSMGAATCSFLAKRGHKVLGLEQFNIRNEHISDAGQSRAFHKACFEHPDYVPLLNRAYENWESLEQETGEKICYRTGMAYFGEPGNAMMTGVNKSTSLYNIPVENYTAFSSAERFPQFTIPKGFSTLFEPDAGLILSKKAIQLYKQQSIEKGATIHTKEKVIEWKKDGNGIVVTTGKNTYHCDKLIITAGAWTGKVLPELEPKIKVTRQFVAWIKPKKEKEFDINEFTCWMIADDERPGYYYGFPMLDTKTFGGPAGLKVAHHYPGAVTDPDTVNRVIQPEDLNNLFYALSKYLPNVFETVLSATICLYENSQDENFIIDKLPGYEEQVTFACGFNGHGFQFSSVVGEILADLATEGKTEQPIDFLSVKRFGEG